MKTKWFYRVVTDAFPAAYIIREVEAMGMMILMGALAAFGFVCALKTAALFFGGRKGGPVICVCRPGLSALPTVRRLCRLREWGLLGCEVVLLDLGISSREREVLTRAGKTAVIWGPEQLLAGQGTGAEVIDGTGIGDSSGHGQCCHISEL